MADFNSSGNSQFVKINTNTRGVTFFDNYNNMLSLNFYDNAITLSFATAMIDANGSRRYPKEARTQILITNDRVAAFYDIIQKKFLAAMEEGSDYSGGIFTSKDGTTILELSTGSVNTAGKKEPQLLLYSDIDDKFTAKSTKCYTFRATPVIEGFVSGKNNHTIKEVEGQLILFIKCLEAFLDSNNNAYAHADRVANRYHESNVFSYITQIAVKLGIPVKTYGNGGNNTNAFMQDPNAGDAQTPMKEINNLSEMLPGDGDDLPF